MVSYSLQCWDGVGPAIVDSAAQFVDHEEAIAVALAMAANHVTVELRRGDELVAYIKRTDAELMARSKTIH